MSYKTITEPASADFTEQRSRFLSTIYPVTSEAEAVELINARRQQYWDARHNVYAYRLAEGNIARFSDDGEPHSTAGKPTLEVLAGAELTNCLLITTRYFGGILLGTGGLVRAYSTAARLAVEAAKIVVIRDCIKYRLTISYSVYDRLLSFLNNRNITILSTDFFEQINMQLILPEEDCDDFCVALRDTFFDEFSPEFIEKCKFAL